MNYVAIKLKKIVLKTRFSKSYSSFPVYSESMIRKTFSSVMLKVTAIASVRLFARDWNICM